MTMDPKNTQQIRKLQESAARFLDCLDLAVKQIGVEANLRSASGIESRETPGLGR